jgi:hypothetical protein
MAYICARCTPDFELAAYGFQDAPLREIRSPRIVRELIFRGPGARPWHRHVIVWWNGPDRLPGAPIGSVHLEHWSSPLERWRVTIDPAVALSVETVKAQLREALLKQLSDHVGLRHVGDRYFRQDGSEVVLVPGEPTTALPTVVARSGLFLRVRIRNHRQLGAELRRRTGVEVEPREFASIPRHMGRTNYEHVALYNQIMGRHWEAIRDERARRSR